MHMNSQWWGHSRVRKLGTGFSRLDCSDEELIRQVQLPPHMVVAPLILICIYFLQACSSSVLDPSPSLSPKCPVVDISHSVIPIATPWLVLHHPKLLFPLHGMVKYSITGKEFPYGHILVDFPHFSIFRVPNSELYLWASTQSLCSLWQAFYHVTQQRPFLDLLGWLDFSKHWI